MTRYKLFTGPVYVEQVANELDARGAAGGFADVHAGTEWVHFAADSDDEIVVWDEIGRTLGWNPSFHHLKRRA